jgi:penicillin-binding protein 1C
LQQRVGTGSFLELLRACGLGTLDRPGRSYGLTLCLGGGEVCLLDLAAAYATLVRLGEHLPRRVLDDARPAATRRVVSAAAARWVLDALSTPEHLRRLRGRVPQAEGFRWGYKTGTSYGFRDAWAFAFSAERVVGVWIGDPEGRPLPELVGLEAAAPLAFAVLAQLSSRAPADWPQAEGSVEASVCSASGYPLGRFCPAAKLGRRIAGAPELPACSVHHEVLIDRERGVEVCRACKGGRSVERRVVEDWPHEVAAWMRLEAGGAGPPPHDADCRARVAGAAPRILTPAAGEEYLYVPGGPARQRVAFEAAAPSGARRLSWFVDGAFLASAAAGERVPWPLAPGRHEVRCVDDRGRAAAVEFRVERWKPRR